MNIVKLNVGGVNFWTTKDTLKSFPTSRLAKLDHESQYYITDLECYFFDRNPRVFHYVLECYRVGKFHVPVSMCWSTVENELKFWELDVEKVLSTCCLASYSDFQEKSRFHEHVYGHAVDKANGIQGLRKKLLKARGWQWYRYKIWMFLELPESSLGAQVMLFPNLK